MTMARKRQFWACIFVATGAGCFADESARADEPVFGGFQKIDVFGRGLEPLRAADGRLTTPVRDLTFGDIFHHAPSRVRSVRRGDLGFHRRLAPVRRQALRKIARVAAPSLP